MKNLFIIFFIFNVISLNAEVKSDIIGEKAPAISLLGSDNNKFFKSKTLIFTATYNEKNNVTKLIEEINEMKNLDEDIVEQHDRFIRLLEDNNSNNSNSSYNY